MGSVCGNTDTTHLPLEKTPVIEHVKKVIRWVIGLGILGTVMILYYLMTVDVASEKITQEVETKGEVLRVLKRDQEFAASQVSRIVSAIERANEREHRDMMTLQMQLAEVQCYLAEMQSSQQPTNQQQTVELDTKTQ